MVGTVLTGPPPVEYEYDVPEDQLQWIHRTTDRQEHASIDEQNTIEDMIGRIGHKARARHGIAAR